MAAISSSKRRQEYIAGHSLLRLAARQALGVDASFGGTDEKQHWQQPANSAPQLPQHPNLTFGLSHSGGWVAAVVESTGETTNVDKTGVDIELERERKNLTRLARYSFTEDWLHQHREDLLPAFFQRWTLCEALVKGSQKTLGTELLRHQRFASVEPDKQPLNTGRWLYHTRIAPEHTPYSALGLNKPMHISLCSERHYPRCKMRVLCLTDNKFMALEPIAFSTFQAV
ncbi:4'-phosphopantetheinyl transferase superfamily protein [Simiduia curdlanivorans]|uniref:4'-phosphopantetheinyl transferase family protein n=1 Tax=Simiduia curdlanivorans TaxID=1492769 RepID=A0ABV8V6Z1_9GAMM|nr:4'-phosphopantetheinyl transferase superfamily protein [Simiduia curdlanivorans]MDN3640811.1 4'-phosphopantetheinyl transferase superfamily protein [Simiduia curdlanivorans]